MNASVCVSVCMHVRVCACKSMCMCGGCKSACMHGGQKTTELTQSVSLGSPLPSESSHWPFSVLLQGPQEEFSPTLKCDKIRFYIQSRITLWCLIFTLSKPINNPTT